MKDFVKGRIKELLSGEFYCGPEALNEREGRLMKKKK